MKRKPPTKQKISGYWRKAPSGEEYFVRSYKRKKTPPWNKGKKFVRAEVVQPKKVLYREPKPITVKPLKPRKGKKPGKIVGYRWKERIMSVEPADRVAYTIRIVALVDFNYQYTMSFTPADFDGKPGPTAKHLQYYHTDFTNTPEDAYVDFREKVPVMRAYGDIQFIDIQLMRVSGDGPITERHYKVMQEFAEPEDVPGFSNRD